ncbi:MAG TPA: SUMF1/EgtB/PvdO family nonheme iron enzyme [Ktedonobacterales bacterium]
MPNDDPSTRGWRQRGSAWFRKVGAAFDSPLFPGYNDRWYARSERELALLVRPPVENRFPQRLADLGFVRHGEAASSGGYIIPPLCHVDAGPFLMGSDPREDMDAEDNELPQRTVETEAYQIGTYPVTVAEYDCAVRAGVVREPQYLLATWTFQLQRLDFPVACISWADATAYAAWLARLTGQAWRLPTEAEWEKAARGADGRRYPWGNQWDSSRANVDKEAMWYLEHEQQGTGKRGSSFVREWARRPERFEDEPTPVGAYSGHGDASPCGAHDLAGNIWEWTSSLYRPYPYSPGDGREDPTATGTRVLRGGCWASEVSEARAANRNGNAPAEPDDGMGFRLALAASPRSC